MSARFYGYIHSIFGSMLYVSPNNSAASQEQMTPGDFDSIIAAPVPNMPNRFIFRLKPGKELIEPYTSWLKGSMPSKTKSSDDSADKPADSPTLTGTIHGGPTRPEATKPVLTRSAFEANMAEAKRLEELTLAEDLALGKIKVGDDKY